MKAQKNDYKVYHEIFRCARRKHKKVYKFLQKIMIFPGFPRRAPARERLYSQNPENRNLSKPHFQEK
jgi:hypothetical protein